IAVAATRNKATTRCAVENFAQGVRLSQIPEGENFHTTRNESNRVNATAFFVVAPDDFWISSNTGRRNLSSGRGDPRPELLLSDVGNGRAEKTTCRSASSSQVHRFQSAVYPLN